MLGIVHFELSVNFILHVKSNYFYSTLFVVSRVLNLFELSASAWFIVVLQYLVQEYNLTILWFAPHNIICSLGATSDMSTVVSIVSSRYTYCCLETSRGKITRHYSRYCAVAFCYVHKCELSYMCPGHDIQLHPHRVELYRIGCVGSGLVLMKALT